MAGEAAHVQLVDDGVFERREQRDVFVPVEGAAKEQAAARGPRHTRLRIDVPRRIASPDAPPRHGRARRVEEDKVGIKAMPKADRAIDANHSETPAASQQPGCASDPPCDFAGNREESRPVSRRW